MPESLFPDFAAEQWRLTRLQVCNWGGYDGYHDVPFPEGTTLITGASGTGKSTLLDAYIAVMMSGNKPFNGASNEGGGHARGPAQRSLLTYIRGKLDTTSGGRDTVLRGDGTAAWGAIASTYTSTTGRIFTVLRVIFVRADATQNGDVKQQYATLDGPLDLSLVSHCRDARFSNQALKAQYPGLVTYSKVTPFLSAIYTQLGIGIDGDGARAVDLLHKIQSGQTVKSVDELYRALVLEAPAAFDVGDTFVETVRTLEASRQQIEREAAQVDCLQPLPERHAKYTAVLTESAQLTRLGIDADPTQSTLHRWLDLRQRELGQSAILSAQRDLSAMEGTCEELQRIAEARDLERKDAQAAASGHSSAAERAVDDANRQLAAVQRAHASFVARCAALPHHPTNRHEFNQVTEDARAFLDSYPSAQGTLDEAQERISARKYPLLEKRRALQEELESLEGRSDQVPRPHAAARDAVAAAVGLTPADLPFVAELIDVKDEEWRTAAEATLRGFGLTMVYDVTHQQRIRSAIDAMSLGVRLRFEGVHLNHLPPVADPAPHMLSSHLQYKEGSRFSAWVRLRAQNPAVDHRCVDSPDELGGDTPAVTRHGQTSRGDRGAHGQPGRDRRVLGFSNDALKNQLHSEISDLDTQLSELSAEQRSLASKRKTLDQEKDSFEEVLRHEWSEIDVPTAEAAAQRAQETLDQFLTSNPDLAALARRAAEAQEAHLDAHSAWTAADAERKRAQRVLDTLKSDVNGISKRLALSAGQRIVEEDAARLEELFYQRDRGGAYETFERDRQAFVEELTQRRTNLKSRISHARERVESVLEQFQAQWPDNDRGTGIDFVAQYLDIYQNLQANKLGEQRDLWRGRFIEDAGRALTHLKRTLDSSRKAIDERLEPINRVLSDLSFGAEDLRLRIAVSDAQTDEYRQFRREVTRLASHSTDTSASGKVARIEELCALQEKLSPGPGSARGRLLDVRAQIRVTAEAVDAHGNVASVYDTLGGKSGGETQELIAFIIGAALRYQLGDDFSEYPRFAPVILDEGFIKADARFAGRAIQAWKALGFQLILGTPVDKVTGLERHCDNILCVSKSGDGQSRAYMLTDAEREHGVQAH